MASIGRSGRPTTRPMRASPAAPSRERDRATSPRSPCEHVRAADVGDAAGRPPRRRRRPSTPSSAPWRRPPSSSPRRNAASSAVARAKSAPSASRRAACEPAPDSAPIRSNAASTSRDGERRGLGRRRARPSATPSRRRSGAGAARRRGTRRPAGDLARRGAAAAHPPAPATLAVAGTGRGDGGGDRDELGEQHRRIVSHRPWKERGDRPSNHGIAYEASRCNHRRAGVPVVLHPGALRRVLPFPEGRGAVHRRSPRRGAFQTAEELARRANTSSSTVVRF